LEKLVERKRKLHHATRCIAFYLRPVAPACRKKPEGQLLTNANELLDGFLYFAAAARKLAEASKLTQNNASDTCLL
jgi:hypothetical protein